MCFYEDKDEIIELERISCNGFVNSITCFVIDNTMFLVACGGREKKADRFVVLREKSWVRVWEVGKVDVI